MKTEKNLLGDEKYEAPKEQEIVIDGSVTKDVKELPPFEQIKLASEKFGIEINDPKENCKTCYGRGFDGWRILNPNWKREKAPEEKEPVPCLCIFPKKIRDQQKQSGMMHNKKGMEKLAKQARNTTTRRRIKQRDRMTNAEKELRNKALRLNKPYELLKAEKVLKSQKKKIKKTDKPVEETVNE